MNARPSRLKSGAPLLQDHRGCGGGRDFTNGREGSRFPHLSAFGGTRVTSGATENPHRFTISSEKNAADGSSVPTGRPTGTSSHDAQNRHLRLFRWVKRVITDLPCVLVDTRILSRPDGEVFQPSTSYFRARFFLAWASFSPNPRSFAIFLRRAESDLAVRGVLEGIACFSLYDFGVNP